MVTVYGHDRCGDPVLAGHRSVPMTERRVLDTMTQHHERSMSGQKKAGKTLGQTKDQTPFLPLLGTRKVVSTPTIPFDVAGTAQVFVPKEIIARRIQDICVVPNKGRKADHYFVRSKICHELN